MGADPEPVAIAQQRRDGVVGQAARAVAIVPEQFAATRGRVHVLQAAAGGADP